MPVLALLSFSTACTDKDDDNESTDTNEATDTDAEDTAGPDDTGDTGEPIEPPALELIGSWTDAYGGNHLIDADTWTTDYSGYTISQFDNDAGWVVAQNDSTNGWNPDLWSKFQWATDSAGELFYCQIAFDAADEQAAIDTPDADVTDMVSGCNGFGWSQIRHAMDLTGSYDDQYDTSHKVSPFSWTTSGGSIFTVSQHDNDSAWVIAQNASTNDWSPDLWSKFQWATDADGGLHYCQSVFGAATEDEAISGETADVNDLVAGCGGFPWTALRDPLPVSNDWIDEYLIEHSVNAWKWETPYGKYFISQADTVNSFVVAQNAPTNGYNPNLWSKIQWTTDQDGANYYCQIAFDAADEQAALDTPAADAGDLTTGCNTNPWSQMRLVADFSGDYEDDFGYTFSLNSYRWTNGSGSFFSISQYDEQLGWIVAQNDSSNSWSPNLWSKFDLTSDTDGEMYFCQSTYDAMDEQTALDALSAATDNLTTGCNGFPWSKMRHVLPIAGSWVDEFTVAHDINSYQWVNDYGAYNISMSDLKKGFVVAQNDASNTYSPDLWSKFQWTTEYTTGDYYYCQIAFDSADEAAALAVPLGNAFDLTTGCNSNPWSRLSTVQQ